jgi:hypothetical protein
LVLFLRSDIYVEVVAFAKERDKLPVRFISWDDPSLLLRIVGERFARSGALINRPDEVWDRYFCPVVRGVPSRDFLVTATLPRPRDMIYFVRSSLDHAVNSGNTKIEESDLIAATQQYSRYALDSLLVEGSTKIDKLEDILYEFAGCQETIGADAINRAVLASGSSTEAEAVTDTLINLSFLGIEVQAGRFEFLSNDSERTKFRSMAKHVTDGNPQQTPRYRISRPFHPYLEIVADS